MTNEEVFPYYEALWRRTPVEELYIHYEGWSLGGESGYFHHEGQGNGNAKIVIVRPHYTAFDEPTMDRNDGKHVDLAAEMITLAHEYGHFLSFSGSTPRETWDAYYRVALHRDQVHDALATGASIPEALGEALSAEEQQLILTEETTAWDLGRQFIPERLQPEYERRARHGVHCHRYLLGLDPQPPDDDAQEPA